MLYDDGIINTLDYNIYNRWYDEFIKDFPLTGNIYLKTEPEKAYERVLKRNRNEEEGIPLEYLKKCNDYHNKWLMSEPKKMIIDGNKDMSENKESKYIYQIPSNWLSDVEKYLKENV